MPTPVDALITRINKKAVKDKEVPFLIKGSELKNRVMQRATTGSLGIDLMLGGGWPLNQWNEVMGDESSGKTALTMKTIAANQALDPNYHCLWVASEDFVPAWAEQLGMDLDRTTVIESNVTEVALQAVLDFMDERACDAVVIDSLPALISDEELQKDMDESSVSVNARLIGKFFRKEGAVGRRSLTEADRPFLGLVINQYREKIGVTHGDPRTTPGGRAKNYSFFTRVELARLEWIKDNQVPVGLTIKARAKKNKTFPPQRTCQIDFYFDDYQTFHAGDFDLVKEMAFIAMAYDIIEQSASWYQYRGEKWQGKDAVFAHLRGDITMQRELDSDVRRIVLHET